MTGNDEFYVGYLSTPPALARRLQETETELQQSKSAASVVESS